MPFIDVKITKSISDAEKTALKTELGNAISLFPGKSEAWLMCNIESDSAMWFRGENVSHCAFVEVKLFGNVDKNASEKFTAEVCDYFGSNFSISPDHVYIRYEGGTDWGWNGNNF